MTQVVISMMGNAGNSKEDNACILIDLIILVDFAIAVVAIIVNAVNAWTTRACYKACLLQFVAVMLQCGIGGVTKS